MSADDALWGHWPLKTDIADHSGQGRHPTGGERVQPPPRVDPELGVVFDGVQQCLETPLPEGGLGTRDFTVSMWVHTEQALKDDLGTLISCSNFRSRTGFHFSLKNSTGCTSSQSNWRQLEFGVDAGTEPEWREEGRPGNALLAFGLCAHDGHLYAATCEPGESEAGRVYRYVAPGQWRDLGPLDGANSVTALAAFDGALYAGTGKYRLAGSALPESKNEVRGGRIYRLLSGDRWELVGELPETDAVASLAVYDGRLYATSLYRPAGFLRFEGPGRWARLPTPNGKRVEALRVHNGALFAGSYDGGNVYRFDGTEWTDLGVVGENTQTYSFACFAGNLLVGTWPSGCVYRLTDGIWVNRGRLGEELEVMGMAVYNGALYAGTLPSAEMYRFEIGGNWTRLKQLDDTPDVKYRRVWTMAAHQGRLFCSTLPSGRISSMSTGACATYDRELPPDWQHVAAVRQAGQLRVYVNGEPVSTTTGEAKPPLDLSDARILMIGQGPLGFFSGRLRDVRLHARALRGDEIRSLAGDRSSLDDEDRTQH